jgi:hypothetical protein
LGISTARPVPAHGNIGEPFETLASRGGAGWHRAIDRAA